MSTDVHSPSNRRTALAATLGLAAVVIACCGCGSSSSSPKAERSVAAPKLRGQAIPNGAPALPFALRDQNGRLTRLTDQRGRLVLIAFLYTECRDVCPLIAGGLNRSVQALGDRANDVRILAVSVDPQRDTPAAVRRYVRTHHLGPQFHWLIGTKAQLARVWQDYNILVERRTLDQIAHAAPVYLLDRNGKPRVLYPPPPRQPDIEHDLRALLSA
jgi:protein SCO1/2